MQCVPSAPVAQTSAPQSPISAIKISKPNQGSSNYKEPPVILYARRKSQDKKATPAARYSVHPWSVTNDKTMNKTILNYTQEMLSTTIRLVQRCGT